MEDLLQQPVFDGPAGPAILYTLLLVAAFLVGQALHLVGMALARWHKGRGFLVSAATFEAAGRSAPFLLVGLAARLALPVLRLNEEWKDVVTTSAAVVLSLAVGYAVYRFVAVPDAMVARYVRRTGSRVDTMLVPVVRKSLKIAVLFFVLLHIFTLLSHQSIGSIVAGLGIGGLAVALAAKDSIGHFFGSLTLIADGPFQVGERVVVDGHDGPVEKVGLRSTRIRTLEGHLVTVPNGELVNKTIQNIGQRPYIRRLARLSITYDTPPEKIEEAVSIVEDILKDHEGMDPEFPPRIYFSDLKGDCLELLMIYWYHPPAYWDYMAFNQRVNLQLMRRFAEAGIDWAFPTQTLYLAGDEQRPLRLGIEDITPKPGEGPGRE